MIRTILAVSMLTFPACAQSGVSGKAAPAGADPSKIASADLRGTDGASLGLVFLTQTTNGVLISAALKGLPEGEHAFHIHAQGTCDPDFGAAGGHFAPKGEPHGFRVDGGPHAGDMPNIYVPASGELGFEVFNPRISLLDGEHGHLFDEDGAAIMIHAGADDYQSQPSGAAGARIGCGVIEQSE